MQQVSYLFSLGYYYIHMHAHICCLNSSHLRILLEDGGIMHEIGVAFGFIRMNGGHQAQYVPIDPLQVNRKNIGLIYDTNIINIK